MLIKRKSGISVLLATQNSEKTVELSIKSFVDFADEIIAVDNGSKDSTIEILGKLSKEIWKLKFYNVPELPDLYHNRQYALEHSNYNWIARLDSDYIAYTDGKYHINNLREIILNTKRFIRPVVFDTTQVNLVCDYYHTGMSKEKRGQGKGHYIPPPVTSYSARIIQYFPGMKFIRRRRWEGVRFQRYLKHIRLEKPYWFHCEFKSDMDYFYRSERTNWRELGNFKKYPTLGFYVKDVIKDKYGTDDIKKACKIYMQKDFFPYLEKYDPEKYYPYPELIKEQMKKC
jgi:glycosyltransferase involved in cell wall biosynthesis